MGILDGFWFWIGKALAEIALSFGFLILFIALVFAYFSINDVVRWWKKRRATKETVDRT